MARVAILNSRQSKTPHACDAWVVRTREAVCWAAETHHEVVSSLGQFTWELVSWESVRLGLPVRLIAPEMEPATRQALADDLFGAQPRAAALVHWETLGETLPLRSKRWWPQRDLKVMELAEVVLPVSLREKSTLTQLLSAHRHLNVDNRFQVPHRPESHHLRSPIDPSRWNPELDAWPEGFLIHWTRAAHGPWPGESRDAYFREFVSNAAGEPYHRSGFRTLERILGEQLLRGSAWRIGSGVPMVAFTECSPRESIPLIRWRPRWSRWSFEPYGIAIHQDLVSQWGGRPVRYVADADWETLSPDQSPWCHRRGQKADIWPAEREWRVMGDLDLSKTPKEACRVIVRTPAEADLMSRHTSFEVVSIHV